LWRAAIIGALALALATLGGCSALRVGYAQAPQLVHWWLDGYLDFDDNQAVRARESIRAWFRWHRATQLADYAALLARMQAEMPEPMTPGQACRLWDEVTARIAAAAEPAIPAAVELARTLSAEQIAHLQRRQGKNNADYRSEFLQDSMEERMKASLKRVLDRAEMLYGRLDEVQRERIAQWVGDSPFDPQAWLAERQRRQRELVAVLRRLSTEAVPPAEANAMLRRLYDELWRSPNEPYRAYQQRLARYNCAFAAQVHNMTTPEQRRHAAARLKGWEEDLRALASGS
jgi:hypothetical protein